MASNLHGRLGSVIFTATLELREARMQQDGQHLPQQGAPRNENAGSEEICAGTEREGGG